jgi:hypothetical protein
VALTREGDVVRLFVGGALIGSSTLTQDLWVNTGDVNIGGLPGFNQSFQGMMDDVRVTVGVARYTSAFTPPTEAHPDIACE